MTPKQLLFDLVGVETDTRGAYPIPADDSEIEVAPQRRAAEPVAARGLVQANEVAQHENFLLECETPEVVNARGYLGIAVTPIKSVIVRARIANV